MFSDIAAVEARISQLGERGPLPNARPGDNGAAFATIVSAGAPPAATTIAANAGGSNARRLIPSATIERLIADACAANGTDPALVKAVVANESGFDASATSLAGAQGLMQLMPATAAGLGVSDPYDPRQSIAGGTRYLHGLLQRFGGDVSLAVASYNAGPGAVERGQILPETARYVHAVLGAYAAYRSAERGVR